MAPVFQSSCTSLQMSNFEHVALVHTTEVHTFQQKTILKKDLLQFTSMFTCFVESGSVIQVVNPYFSTMTIKNDVGRII